MANRLAGASSPYLRQHANNPVAWLPWGEEALTLARDENKPILLSIGYSACHWCHVMAHESFEDPAVAAVMNERFINIKDDREERPDLDQIYQTAHALMTRRSGGWPLTVFLTPDGAPYFAGTYFPKQPRYGMPGFLDLLPRIADAFHDQGPAIAEQAERLSRALDALEPTHPANALPSGAPAQELARLTQAFDPVDGGFGGAPKFPHAAELDFCLRAWRLRGDDGARTIVRTSLERMAAGGIFDQLGGGFCRYSVDARWSIPHFEKMLYDNAALLALYADAARALDEPRFGAVAKAIVSWLVREMRAPDGAFYSSLDADSEGVEGKYYVWTRDEVRAVLSGDEWTVAAAHYGLDGPPNFEQHAFNLRVAASIGDVAAKLGASPADVEARLSRARAALLAARAARVRPGLDDKVLTSWNALMIAALARAARTLCEPAFADLAFAALDTLVATAWRDGRLYATRHRDVASLPAYLDDHAFLLAALLEAMQTRFRLRDFSFAVELADALLERFEDRERGGFWFTSHDHERLYHRTKPLHDNATPSGNGIAAQSLIMLGHLAAEPRYVDAAERTLKLFAPALAESGGAQSTLLVALERLLAPPSTVVLDGERATTQAWQRMLERKYRPDVCIVDIAGAGAPAPLRKGDAPADGARAWICRGLQCLPPVAAVDAIILALDAS
ncbi:MAG TPA: thioredoxin domain-containing protein [Casimicrobiaceae bacterium]|nr:thioredoxin domain-containing protein [Casimicrobiaceae bacterium]